MGHAGALRPPFTLLSGHFFLPQIVILVKYAFFQSVINIMQYFFITRISLTHKNLSLYIPAVKKEVIIRNTTAPRIKVLDFVKGIAIICIIIGHSGQGEL